MVIITLKQKHRLWQCQRGVRPYPFIIIIIIVFHIIIIIIITNNHFDMLNTFTRLTRKPSALRGQQGAVSDM